MIKTIGDEAMIVGPDPAALTDWAVGFQRLQNERPLPRIAVHYGVALYRDGDYYGRDVNIASRVAARSAAGEVLVTRPVVDYSGAPHLEFERIAEVKLKGFHQPTRSSSPANAPSRDARTVVADGLLAADRPVVVMLLGSRDSTCLLDLATRVAGVSAVTAVHVNYGLRAAADADERHCAELCERQGVQLDVRRPVESDNAGNLRPGRGKSATVPPPISLLPAALTSPPATPDPIRWKPSSIGWRPHRAGGLCSGCDPETVLTPP